MDCNKLNFFCPDSGPNAPIISLAPQRAGSRTDKLESMNAAVICNILPDIMSIAPQQIALSGKDGIFSARQRVTCMHAQNAVCGTFRDGRHQSPEKWA